jgi:hypothetical protein
MSAVQSAVREAVVRIGSMGEGEDAQQTDRDRTFWGSGFFVAPGWVLTSAHVVGKGRGAVWRGEPVIGVTTSSGTTLPGELAYALPAPADPDRPRSHWGAPDLALVWVPSAALPGEEPDCLWLSDRSSLSAKEALIAGYVSGAGRPEYVVGEVSASGGDTGLVSLQGKLLPGCSGGPVVDALRGSVIGVNKGQNPDGSTGGLAVPITSLREFVAEGGEAARVWRRMLSAHERHHLERYESDGERHSWVRLQLDLDPGGYVHHFSADHRAQLFSLLAPLPPPREVSQVRALVEEIRDEVLRESYQLRMHTPRSWREGVGLLYEPRDGHDADPEESRNLERGAVLLYAAKVWTTLRGQGGQGGQGGGEPPAVDPAALNALGDWLRDMAVRVQSTRLRQRVNAVLGDTPHGGGRVQPAQSAHACAPYADVLVEIDPDLYGMHPWRVKLLGSDGRTTPVRHNDNGVPRDELERDIRAALALALETGDSGEHPASVDFMLPRELLDEPVELWRARERVPEEPFHPDTVPLGQRRPVALRDGYRWAHLKIPEWHGRWAERVEGPMVSVPLCEVGHRHTKGQDQGGQGEGGQDQGGQGEGEGGRSGRPQPESEEAAYYRLRWAGSNDVPVHCARVGSGRGARALAIALAAGHSVVLWRRCDERHADCEEFYAGAARLLSSVSEADGPRGGRSLPELVRALRARGVPADAPDSDNAWARQLVLLYDPPHGPRLPAGPLRAPPLRQ